MKYLLLASLLLLASPAHAGWLDAIFGNDYDDTLAILNEPTPIPDYGEGNPDAPVNIIEYASFTCPVCASFHTITLPILRERVLDKGMAKLTVRLFPLNPSAVVASMISLCVAENGPPESANERFVRFSDALFATQNVWLRGRGEIVDALAVQARKIGLSRKAFDACLQREDLLKGVQETYNSASSKLDVSATPTFFINGEKLQGNVSVETLEQAVKRALERGN